MKKEDYIYNAEVVKVVDGDTIDVNVDLGFTVWVRVRLRLIGIDTMELNDKDPVKRENAKLAKAFVEDRLVNQKVIIQSFKTDKYGRWLAEVFVNGSSINKQLLAENLAIPYGA
jgi:micrococcal nuclease